MRFAHLLVAYLDQYLQLGHLMAVFTTHLSDPADTGVVSVATVATTLHQLRAGTAAVPENVAEAAAQRVRRRLQAARDACKERARHKKVENGTRRKRRGETATEKSERLAEHTAANAKRRLLDPKRVMAVQMVSGLEATCVGPQRAPACAGVSIVHVGASTSPLPILPNPCVWCRWGSKGRGRRRRSGDNCAQGEHYGCRRWRHLW